MAHDIFICHASPDLNTALAACAKLEAAHVRCWIAPRDVGGGAYAGQLVRAIATTKAVLLVFSDKANASENVLRELEIASANQKIIIPFRIEDVRPNEDLQYFTLRMHWLDALSPPLESRLDELVAFVQRLLAAEPVLTLPVPPEQAAEAERRQVEIYEREDSPTQGRTTNDVAADEKQPEEKIAAPAPAQEERPAENTVEIAPQAPLPKPLTAPEPVWVHTFENLRMRDRIITVLFGLAGLAIAALMISHAKNDEWIFPILALLLAGCAFTLALIGINGKTPFSTHKKSVAELGAMYAEALREWLPGGAESDYVEFVRSGVFRGKKIGLGRIAGEAAAGEPFSQEKQRAARTFEWIGNLDATQRLAVDREARLILERDPVAP